MSRPPRKKPSGTRAPRRRTKVQPRSRAQRLLLRFGWLLPLGAVLIGGGILLLTYAFASIPLPRDIKLASSAEVFDRNGKLIGTYSGEITRYLIDTDELLDEKPFIGQAVIAAEDREFYKHNGVSFRGIVRAAWANVTGGGVVQGGSTITQQYVKQAVLQDPERTITRKVKEAVLAIKLERRYSKREILGFYLNTIYLGRGSYGFEAAAESYFAKDADELTLGEAAFLAGIIPAPERYQPDENQQLARDRRDGVLRSMVSEGFITQAQADKAMRKKVKLAEGVTVEVEQERAAYFLEWIRKRYLYPEYGSELYTRGFKIHTTLDLEMQEQAEAAVTSVLTLPEDPQAALVSMTPRGEVRAMVGNSKDFTSVKKARGFNYATDFPGRQPGSSFKPFTLATAIEEGISPTSTFSGRSPISIENPECSGPNELGVIEPWQPENYGGASYGTMTLEQATTNSVNTVYAQLIAEVGPEKVADLVEEFGFAPKYGADEITPNCSLALGGSEDVTPLEMARAYAGFAARGRLPEVMPITYITDSQGNCVIEFRPSKRDCEEEREVVSEQVIEQNSADVLTQSLTNVVEAGTATVANIGRPVAGKTGTTQNNGNAWFAGYTPQLVTVVWEGYPIDPGPDGKFALECGTKIKNEDKRIAAQNACAEDDFIPEMRSCYDANPELCRPVHGYDVTGGGAPVSPAVIWANFMREATADMEILPFPVPVDMPDEVINEGPPTPVSTGAPEPDETEEPEPEPSEEPEPEPTETVEPTPEPTPTVQPTPDPTGTGGAGGDTEGAGGTEGKRDTRRSKETDP